MVKAVRMQYGAFAQENGLHAAGWHSSASVSKTDEEQEENGWVIVKKQTIRIWIPSLSTAKPWARRTNLRRKKNKSSLTAKVQGSKKLSGRYLKHLQDEQNKSVRVAEDRANLSKPLCPAPTLSLSDEHLPLSMFMLASKTSNRSTRLQQSKKQSAKARKSSRGQFSTIRLQTGSSGARDTQPISSVATSRRYYLSACSRKRERTSALGLAKCLNMAEVQNQEMRASNINRKLKRAGGLGRWLEAQGLEQFVPMFRRENVNELQLLGLTMGKLSDMGAHAVGPRRKLIHAIDQLSQPYYY